MSFPLLESAPISHTMPVPASGEPDFLALPDSAAVVIFESGAGATVLIATTASAREMARRRLCAPEAGERTKRADLRSVLAGGRVLAIAVGSALEADVVYLRQARERLPEAARVAAERWRPWFVHVDPAAEFPQWTKTNLGGEASGLGLGNPASVSPTSQFLGPIPDKHAAARFMDAITDAFDLCRFHHILVQAPRASACAYKEMGRCPAPCDGSETMEQYRARSLAAAAAAKDLAGFGERLAAEMAAAATGQDFEKAARLKLVNDRLAPARKPAFAHVHAISDLNYLFVVMSPVRHHARLVLFAGLEYLFVADVALEKSPDLAGIAHAVCSRIAGKSDRPLTLTPTAIDSLSLLARHVFMPKKSRAADPIYLPRSVPPDTLAATITRSLASLRRTKSETTVEDQQIESTSQA